MHKIKNALKEYKEYIEGCIAYKERIEISFAANIMSYKPMLEAFLVAVINGDPLQHSSQIEFRSPVNLMAVNLLNFQVIKKKKNNKKN